jgi:hypothetical protein
MRHLGRWRGRHALKGIAGEWALFAVAGDGKT